MIEVITPIKESLDYMLETHQRTTRQLRNACIEIDRLNALLDNHGIDRLDTEFNREDRNIELTCTRHTSDEISAIIDDTHFKLGEEVVVKCSGYDPRSEQRDEYVEIHKIVAIHGEWLRFDCVFEVDGVTTKVRHISGIRKVDA